MAALEHAGPGGIVALMGLEDAGHLNPLVALAEQLVLRGLRVYFFVPKTVEDRVRAVGATWCSYGSDDWNLYACAGEVNRRLGMDICPEIANFTLPLAAVVAAPGVMPYLIGRMAQLRPDFIVFDAACPWALLLGRLVRIPAVCSMTALPMPQRVREGKVLTFSPEGQKVCAAAASALKVAYGLDYNPSHGYTNYTPYTVVWSSRAWHKGNEEFDAKTFRYWGPLTSHRPGLPDMAEVSDNRPLVFVSFGTIATGLKADDFRHILRDFYSKLCTVAASTPDLAYLLSVGKRLPLVEADSGRVTALFADVAVPENMHVARSVDQLSVLRRARVFVTHGGQNSSSEAVLAGVPVLACPLWGDQPDNARRFEELGGGLVQSYFPGPGCKPSEVDLGVVSEASLASCIRRLVNEPSFKEAVHGIRARQEAEVGRPLQEKIAELLAHVSDEARELGPPLFPPC